MPLLAKQIKIESAQERRFRPGPIGYRVAGASVMARARTESEALKGREMTAQGAALGSLAQDSKP